ncbi:MAG: MarR family transcriptional regulator [Chloroflexi bacterium]|nr:MAG: MarR family transcriptional regulator [Chloroflexota bacterium]
MSAFDPARRDTPGRRITIALYRIAQALEHLLRRRGRVLKLSPTQIRALLFLKYVRPGVRTIGGLAERLGVTYATSSGVADALERKGLIVRSPLPEDQRVITLSLTPKGERTVEGLEDILEEIEVVVSTLPPTDQAVLLRATQAIVYHLQQAGYVKVYEMCWGCQFFQRDAHPEDPRGPHHCQFVDAPLQESDTYLECPDFIPVSTTSSRKGGGLS